MYALKETRHQAASSSDTPLFVTNESCTRESAGGKGANLARLQSLGYRVPNWFSLTPAAFWSALSDEQTEAIRTAQTFHKVRDVLEDLTIGSALSATIGSLIRQRLGMFKLLAVRSSALDEDGETSSFAGQLDSFLNVIPDDAIDAVKKVWLSAFSERNFEYRRLRELCLTPTPPAVIIQAMVEPKFAGVAFSCEPLSGKRTVAVVTATVGLADGLVSGQVNGQTFLVGENGAVVNNATQQVFTSTKMPEQLAARVAHTARRLRKQMGSEQDIEWALSKGRLYLLQSRPISALPAEQAESQTLWDNSNIGESYHGVTTPLTFSFAQTAYENVYRQFCKMMGVPPKRVSEHADLFPSMIGYANGRIYYNLMNWYRLLSILPGFKSNRNFMEQMMGVKESMPAEVVTEIADRNECSSSLDRAQFIYSTSRTALNLLTLRSTLERFNERFEKALSEVPTDLSVLSLRELTNTYTKLETSLLTKWDAPLLNDFFAMIFYGVLKKLCTQWCGDVDGTLQNSLVCDLSGVISTAPARMLEELAELVRQDEALHAHLRAEPHYSGTITLKGSRVPFSSPNSTKFDALFNQFLYKFGDRCANELKLESPTLNDEPEKTLSHILALASGDAGELSTKNPLRIGQTKSYKELIADVGKTLRHKPLKLRTLIYVINNARELIRQRENLRFQRTRLFGTARRIFKQIGVKLSAERLIDSPDDVYFLEVRELLAICNGTSVTGDVRKLVELRRDEYKSNQLKNPLPSRFRTSGSALNNATLNSICESAQPQTRGDSLSISSMTVKGLGCSPGIVRGRIRVLSNPNPEEPLAANDIVVAERTDPGWIAVFARASGLLVQYGSLLSHSAIVSRELGVPAIVSIDGVTTWLKDGDYVEMNGSTGVVRKISTISSP